MTDEQDKQAQAEQLLKGAYALKTSTDNTRYYRDFAPIYDEQFADALGYSYPAALAAVFIRQQRSEDTPVLDVGCGTGLVAAALDGISDIDGVDLSADMLAVAKQKHLYRQLYCHDLTQGAGPVPRTYGAVVSAGTFTHGHLGPQALQDLLAVGRPGALFCIGINAHHYEEAGFAATFARLAEKSLITECRNVNCAIFSGADSRAADEAIVAVFRRV
jgi:SAM-dependent methyltransferase